jgi:hypothetical protein
MTDNIADQVRLENNEKTNHANLSFGFNLDVDIMLCLIPDSIHQLNGRAGTTRQGPL